MRRAYFIPRTPKKIGGGVLSAISAWTLDAVATLSLIHISCYFMRDTPLQALEQLMMSQPGQKPRGGGIYRSPFHYTPKDVACEYCQNYVRKHPCRLCECTCLEERIEAGVLELNEFVRDCFAPDVYKRQGHKSVGGLRASTYNAMPKEGVEALVECLKKFEAEH